MIRESGGDRSAVTGGTRVLSDEIVVRDHVQARRDLPRPHDRPRRGSLAAEDPERDRADHPARGTHHHLPVGRGDAAALRHLLRSRAVHHRAGSAAGLPDPDDDRRPPVGHRHRRDGSPRAAQRAGHERTRRGGGGRREHAAARQDGHDHVRFPPGGRIRPDARDRRAGPGRGRDAVEPRRRDAGGPLHRGLRLGALRPGASGGARCRPGALHRPDPHERHGLCRTAGRCARARPTRCGAWSRRKAGRSRSSSAPIVDGISRDGATPLGGGGSPRVRALRGSSA